MKRCIMILTVLYIPFLFFTIIFEKILYLFHNMKQDFIHFSQLNVATEVKKYGQ